MTRPDRRRRSADCTPRRRRRSRSPSRCTSARSCCSASHGNVLVYSAPGLERRRRSDRRPRRDRARNTSTTATRPRSPPRRLGAPLFVHEARRASRSRPGCTVRGTFSRRHMLDDDFEAIPTPGHTPRRDRVPVGQRRAPLPVHGRHDLPRRRRVGGRRARARAIASATSRASSSSASSTSTCSCLGRDRRAAVPRRHRPGRRAAPHRRDPRPRAPRRRPLSATSVT